MTVIGVDDTDSRTQGMCTTYVGHQIATDLQEEHNACVTDVLLIRLNPAAKHKTRGNAAIAVHTDASPETAFSVAKENIDKYAVTDDDMTNPATIVAETIPEGLGKYTDRVMHELIEISEAAELIDQYPELQAYYKGNGRGRIGSLAAIGAANEFTDWTYEYISYREKGKWGSERTVDPESVENAANNHHPAVWDTIDRTNGDIVCVPHTPCPILHGIRGDDAEATKLVAEEISSESVKTAQLFKTNQGTDAHLTESRIGKTTENSAYRLSGKVVEEPQTIEGGHVFFTVSNQTGDELEVAAFEPTKNFREYVRNLRNGDMIEICGGITDGTLKLEKFRVMELNRTEFQNPYCTECEKSMSSMGADQGYRCGNCGKVEESKVPVEIERELEKGWYEVPPCARRHISKPLIREDATTTKIHPMT